MTIEEIRKNAPNGATHYKMSRALKGRVMYFKLGKNGLHQWISQFGWSTPFAKLDDSINKL